MLEPVVIKKEIQAQYDDLGERTRKTVEGFQDPARLWRLVEGDRPALAYFRRRKIETPLDLGSFPPRSALVEVGCGTGDYSLLLARAGYRMTGVDLSSKSIEAARAKASILGVSDISFVSLRAGPAGDAGARHCVRKRPGALIKPSEPR
jgi:2-polyprenyl-3-methyl-5-hydroxy-6-metoxy-1,4-benzoquinol methylase